MRASSRFLCLGVLAVLGCRTAPPPSSPPPPSRAVSNSSDPLWSELASLPAPRFDAPTQFPPGMFLLIDRARPYADEQLPPAWFSEFPALRTLLLPGPIQSYAERWTRTDTGFEHTYTTDHWVDPIDGATLEAFDHRCAKAGFERTKVDRIGQKFVVTYSRSDAGLRLRRDAVRQLEIDVSVSVAEPLPETSSLSRALLARPVLLQMARELGAPMASATWSRFDGWWFSFGASRPDPGRFGAWLRGNGFTSTSCAGYRRKWERRERVCWRRDGAPALYVSIGEGDLVAADADAAFAAETGR